MGSLPTGPGLKVTIIGAGVAGLITARVLREKHSVTVLERFPGCHEHGAAISIAPNGTHILEELGFDKARVGVVKGTATRSLNLHGKVVHEMDLCNIRRDFGSDWLFQHRADLWNEFMRLATAPSKELGVSGDPATVVWGAEVVDVDVKSGDVKLADGRTVSSDLVVGADGIKSIIRTLVVGDDAFRTARPSGQSAFRFTLTRATALEVNPDVRTLDRSKPAVLEVNIAMDGSNRSVVCYPCRDFEMLNFVCITNDSTIGVETTESWSAEGNTEDLLRVFDDFYPEIRGLLNAENLKLWQLRDQDPLPTYIKGRTVLIGDAAHAMGPHQGQGATQAVEDAEGFTLFNDTQVDRASVPSILANFDRVRRKRASQIQNHTRQAHDRKSAEQIYKHLKYNWTYPGIRECLARLDAGREMIEI